MTTCVYGYTLITETGQCVPLIGYNIPFFIYLILLIALVLLFIGIGLRLKND